MHQPPHPSLASGLIKSSKLFKQLLLHKISTKNLIMLKNSEWNLNAFHRMKGFRFDFPLFQSSKRVLGRLRQVKSERRWMSTNSCRCEAKGGKKTLPTILSLPMQTRSNWRRAKRRHRQRHSTYLSRSTFRRWSINSKNPIYF